jgi:hypothetical protein
MRGAVIITDPCMFIIIIVLVFVFVQYSSFLFGLAGIDVADEPIQTRTNHESNKWEWKWEGVINRSLARVKWKVIQYAAWIVITRKWLWADWDYRRSTGNLLELSMFSRDRGSIRTKDQDDFTDE